MWTVRGITDLAIFHALGQLDADTSISTVIRAARYGLAPGDINATIQAGNRRPGGLATPTSRGSDRNFPIVVRLKPEFRQSVDAIRNPPLTVANPGGSDNIQIPLSQVADVTLASGPAMIYREDQERYVPIKFGVRKRDLAGAVREAQAKVAAEVQLPDGPPLGVGWPVSRSDRWCSNACPPLSCRWSIGVISLPPSAGQLPFRSRHAAGGGAPCRSP